VTLFRHACLVWVAAVVAIFATVSRAATQELEPGAYWPLPVGLNIVTGVDSFSWGSVTFDPALPVIDADATINTSAIAYTRALSIAGRSANIGIQLPIITGHVEGIYLGTFTEVDRFGLGDPRFRLAINLYGAPAMAPKAFASYRLKTILGVSVAVAPPLGQYDDTKVINLGTNRWAIKSEMGFAHSFGQWVVELMGGVYYFTHNSNFLGGKVRAQDPIASAQAHLTYLFRRNVWLAGDANFYRGGTTSIDGRLNLDLQRNSRVGSTFSAGLTPRQSIRVSVARGAYTTIGADFTSVAVGYNFAWIQH
jgi:hypothetical protein